MVSLIGISYRYLSSVPLAGNIHRYLSTVSFIGTSHRCLSAVQRTAHSDQTSTAFPKPTEGRKMDPAPRPHRSVKIGAAVCAESGAGERPVLSHFLAAPSPSSKRARDYTFIREFVPSNGAGRGRFLAPSEPTVSGPLWALRPTTPHPTSPRRKRPTF